MIWASFRLQRVQLLTLLGVLVVGAGVLVLLRSNMVDAITSAQLTQCAARGGSACASDAQNVFLADWSNLFQIARILIIVMPILIGVFIGAPLFAQELENGTHVLAFTQSVSRTRWMLSKLVVALVPALVVVVVLQYLVWWWLTAAGTLGPRVNGAWNPVNFGIDHVSPIAYTLFAFALGAFIGVVSRRTLVAMTAAFGVFVAVRFVLVGQVNRFVPSERRVAVDAPAARDGGLQVGSGWLDAAGLEVPRARSLAVSDACRTAPSGTPPGQEEFLACMRESGLMNSYALVLPESSAWLAHLYDAAIFGGFAVLLLAGTVWALRRQS
ncbi:ABC-2 family transporter protein [Lentzea waywayandensis]|uniref:ABC-2 family transporter protein n=1 Tax=Lentzea waywayandensis TaxID=84724 RepID=A0A1I6FJ07_9PSEU|nr:ABC transporter permease subunit [Lentzea waywayandensis]SFR29864.1 ABC-2 family transporter protein [Lentzea waywayandensis]